MTSLDCRSHIAKCVTVSRLSAFIGSEVLHILLAVLPLTTRFSFSIHVHRHTPSSPHPHLQEKIQSYSINHCTKSGGIIRLFELNHCRLSPIHQTVAECLIATFTNGSGRGVSQSSLTIVLRYTFQVFYTDVTGTAVRARSKRFKLVVSNAGSFL